MTKIERRRKDVKLYRGNLEADLTALLDETMAAHRAEAIEEAETGETDEPGPPRRVGQKAPVKSLKESIRLAAEYDAMLTGADETAVVVPVWAIGHDEWSHLNDEHPARDDIPEDVERGIAAKVFADDKQRGVNVKTFPPMLLRAALVDPETEIDGATLAERVADRIAKGDKILADLSLSRIHYVKLETAAWNVNVEGDEIPKAFSLVSFLTEGNGGDSKPLNDSE